jgi:multidrug efflux pump subunit AcrB
VVRTLGEAFVLVGIVVFLFLGKLRTTLIPLIAVPVSIIGAFAVMLAVGYTANTVSLLALVLAIGIVVDDAIVVIENVERVVEEEPDLTVPEATKKAMTRSPRRSSPSRWSCCRCSCRSPSFPASAGNCFGSSPWPCRSRC